MVAKLVETFKEIYGQTEDYRAYFAPGRVEQDRQDLSQLRRENTQEQLRMLAEAILVGFFPYNATKESLCVYFPVVITG